MEGNGTSLYRWLSSVGLDEFYDKFRLEGVTEENFTHLQFQDYDSVGISEHVHRQKLFKLIQVVKRELENAPPTAAPRQPSNQEAHAPASALRQRESPTVGKVKAKAASRKGTKTRSASHKSEEKSDTLPSGAPKTHRRRSSSRASIGNEQSAGARIRVAVRKRPINKSEKAKGENDIITVLETSDQIVIHEPKTKVDMTKYIESHPFVFDEVFDENSSNQAIYERTCQPMVEFFLNEGKVTCFAYGQTGSGKTFTMMGPGGGKGKQSGLYVLAARDIFKKLGDTHTNLSLYVSFFEIYGGKLFDLLNERKKLVSREDGKANVVIVGLKELPCSCVDDLLDMIATGNGGRSTGQTGANVDSSRSHAILQLQVKKTVSVKAKHAYAPKKTKLKSMGKFSFIDLAGSERAADTSNNDRQTRLEGAEINKSLLALKECIRALDQQSRHRPFRGSKLTQVLKDSLMGNSRTIMIANISPNASSCEHTLNTLRYADRVKELKKTKKTAKYNAYMPHQARPDHRGDAIDEGSESAEPPPDEVEDVPAEEDEEDEEEEEEEEAEAEETTSRVTGRRSRGRRESRGERVGSQRNRRRESGSVAGGSVGERAAQRAAKRREEGRKEGDASSHPSSMTVKSHHDLCSEILRQEEDIVQAHRSHISDTMLQVQEEIDLLKKFDLLGYSIDEYVDKLDAIMAARMASITSLRERLQPLRSHLREEEKLSSSLPAK